MEQSDQFSAMISLEGAVYISGDEEAKYKKKLIKQFSPDDGDSEPSVQYPYRGIINTMDVKYLPIRKIVAPFNNYYYQLPNGAKSSYAGNYWIAGILGMIPVICSIKYPYSLIAVPILFQGAIELTKRYI